MSKSIHGDHLADDLKKIVNSSVVSPDAKIGLWIDAPKLMEALVIYIVRRDHKVHDSGIETGRMLEKGEVEPEEEA